MNLIHIIYFLIYGKTFLHAMLVLYHCGIYNLGIFSCFAVLFIWLVGSWITQKTPTARGAAYACVSLKSLTLFVLNKFQVHKF